MNKPTQKEQMTLEEAAEKMIKMMQQLQSKTVYLEEYLDELNDRINLIENRLDSARNTSDISGDDWGNLV